MLSLFIKNIFSMKRLSLFLSIILLLGAVSVNAQRRGKKNVKAKKAETEEVVEDPRITIMKSAIQNIIFIDSIVVDKNDFFKHYKLSKEMGSFHSPKEFWRGANESQTLIYMNELKDKCYFANKASDGLSRLYSCDILGDDWGEPYELKGIADTAKYTNINYPYMMPDGITFYFAATGKESIGGYDIFVTRYDSEEGMFLNAENIGMPFNSTANDYLYAIDEFNNLGWFATDRRQPKDKVCIYIFIPSENRKVYNKATMSEDEVNGYATINSIAKTWYNKKAKEEALTRLKRIKNENGQTSDRKVINFIINDNVTYTSEKDFKLKENVENFRRWNNLVAKHETIEKTLAITRNYYASANQKDRDELKLSIINDENELNKLEIEIKQLEKEIRNSENMATK